MKKTLTALCAITFSLAAFTGCSSTPKKSDCPAGTSKEVKSTCCSAKTN